MSMTVAKAVKVRKRVGLALAGLLLAAALAGCGGSGENQAASSSQAQRTTQAASTAGSAGAPPAARVEVRLKDFKFTPSEIRVKPGTTVVFVNDDVMTHNVTQATPETAAEGPYGFESEQLPQGASFERTFDRPGEYPVLCTVGSHYLVGMVGKVVVEN